MSDDLVERLRYEAATHRRILVDRDSDAETAMLDAIARIETLSSQVERMREVVAAAERYISCTISQEHSPYISENGRHGKSPWVELREATTAALKQQASS